MTATARTRTARALQPRLKLWLETRQGTVFGGFRVELLEAVRETGSLAEAAQRTGLSYRRAWGKIREMEGNLGATLVQSEKGGAARGGSRLTPEAERLVAQYRQLLHVMEGHLGKEFQEVFDA
jgi:molybdate transport system regulatory protein